MNRRTETILIVLGIAIFACLLAMPFVLGDGPPQCTVCGQRVTFTVYNKTTDEKLRFCTPHGKEYRDRQPKPELPDAALTLEQLQSFKESWIPSIIQEDPWVRPEPAHGSPPPQTRPADQ